MKLKKIVAFALIVILLGLYIITFIAALTTSPETPHLFKACVFATIIVPVLIYGYLLIYRLAVGKRDENQKTSEDQK